MCKPVKVLLYNCFFLELFCFVCRFANVVSFYKFSAKETLLQKWKPIGNASDFR